MYSDLCFTLAKIPCAILLARDSIGFALSRAILLFLSHCLHSGLLPEGWRLNILMSFVFPQSIHVFIELDTHLPHSRPFRLNHYRRQSRIVRESSDQVSTCLRLIARIPLS